VPEREHRKADFAIAEEIGRLLKIDLEGKIASKVMLRLAATIPDYQRVTYKREIEQWPIVGRRLSAAGLRTKTHKGWESTGPGSAGGRPGLAWTGGGQHAGGCWQSRSPLYDRGTTLMPPSCSDRIPQAYALNPWTPGAWHKQEAVEVIENSTSLSLPKLDEAVLRVMLVPDSAPPWGPLG
jgi:hypothetical protein